MSQFRGNLHLGKLDHFSFGKPKDSISQSMKDGYMDPPHIFECKYIGHIITTHTKKRET